MRTTLQSPNDSISHPLQDGYAAGPAYVLTTGQNRTLRSKKVEHIMRYGKQKSTYASRRKDFSNSTGRHSNPPPQKQGVIQTIQVQAIEQPGAGLCCANLCGHRHQASNDLFVVEQHESGSYQRDTSAPHYSSQQQRLATEQSLSSKYLYATST